MRRWSCVGVAAVVVGLLTGAGPAAAQTIYGFQGTGTGTLNGVAFTDQLFTIAATTDHSSVNDNLGAPGTRKIFAPTVTLKVAGLSKVSFTAGLRASRTASGGFYLQSAGHEDLIPFNSAGLTSWDMTSAAGPVFEAAPVIPHPAGPYNQFSNIGTSGGLLFFTSLKNVTFTAGDPLPDDPTDPTDPASTVPEPSAALLFLPALAVVALARRRGTVARR